MDKSIEAHNEAEEEEAEEEAEEEVLLGFVSSTALLFTCNGCLLLKSSKDVRFVVKTKCLTWVASCLDLNRRQESTSKFLVV